MKLALNFILLSAWETIYIFVFSTLGWDHNSYCSVLTTMNTSDQLSPLSIKPVLLLHIFEVAVESYPPPSSMSRKC